MLLGSLADDEYWSEYGVLVVIDSPGSAYDSADYAGEDDLDPALGLDAELLAVSGMQVPPGGTVAHAGAPDGGAGEPGERLHDTYGELAADLVAVALWTPGGAVGTVADLAARVLASPGKVRAGLRAAVSAGHLRVAGDLGGDGAPLTLTPLPPPPPDHGPPQSLWAEDLGSSTDPAFTDVQGTLERLLSAGIAPPGQAFRGYEPFRGDGGAGFLAIAAIAGTRPSRPRLPDGPPPAAGIITSHRELVVWRAGVPEVLAKVEQYAERAVATPYGIAVIGSKRAVLVRPDGEQLELASDPEFGVALSEDGRHLAIASIRFGRRDRFRLCLADLADGSAQVLDCPANFSIDSLRGGVVTYGMPVGAEPAGFSWAPGRAPWPVPYQEREVDRLTGTCLSRTEPGDYVITRPDGSELTVPRRYDAQDSRLAPGGRWLYDFGYDPPTMTVTDVSGPAPGPAMTWPIPSGRGSGPVFGRPTWEDATHVLLTIPHGDVRAIRIDATSGATERLRLDRHGRGERGHVDGGTEFDVGGFVEPFQLPSVTRHPS